jgi:hypothetical protein
MGTVHVSLGMSLDGFVAGPPVLLGDGVRLFDHVDPERIELEPTRVIDSPRVTHLRYRVVASENGGLDV